MTDQIVLLCEGYHDRAFLSGWLLRHGWRDCRPRPGTKVDDKLGTVTGGNFLFARPTSQSAESLLRVEPCAGDTRIIPRARLRLRELRTKPFERLVLCFDSDDTVGSATPAKRRTDQVTSAIGAPGSTKDGARVDLIVWHTAGTTTNAGLPAVHTLERVVCEAMYSCYPERAAAVDAFLTATPKTRPAGGKEHAWSCMAKWYGEQGCESFLRAVAEDPDLGLQIDAVLRQTGTLATLASL